MPVRLRRPTTKKEKQKGWLVENVVYDTYRDVLPEADYQRQQVAVLDELYRVTKPGGSFFYNHKIRWKRGVMLHPMQWICQSRWQVRQEIVWDARHRCQSPRLALLAGGGENLLAVQAAVGHQRQSHRARTALALCQANFHLAHSSGAE